MTGGFSNAAVIALIAIVPLVALMLTSFVKISVVLSLLRNAIGAPEAPSGLVVMGMSLILSFFVMAPVVIDMLRAAEASPAQPGAPGGGRRGSGAPGSNAAGAETRGGAPGGTAEAPVPGSGVTAGEAAGSAAPAIGAPAAAAPRGAGNVPAGGAPAAPGGAGNAPAGGAPGGPGGGGKPIDVEGAVREVVPPQYQPQVDAAVRAMGPLRAFLARHASARDRETFSQLAVRMGHAVQGDELWVLAPAFLTTELREAFAIAVLIFVPFLVIDLVVGLGLAALGLASTSPQTVALPLKLLLFVAVDGWRLLIEALLRGYA